MNGLGGGVSLYIHTPPFVNYPQVVHNHGIIGIQRALIQHVDKVVDNLS